MTWQHFGQDIGQRAALPVFGSQQPVDQFDAGLPMPFVQAAEQGVFVWETRIERSDRRVGLGTILAHRDVGKATFGHQGFGGVENAFVSLLAGGGRRGSPSGLAKGFRP